MKLDKYSCVRDYEEPDKHCPECEDTTCQDGRTLEVVNEYASTCDGCQELTSHCELQMDEKTQLGYCERCQNDQIS